jgi:hypothetical protein
MWQKLFSLAGSWKTTLLGALALMCSGSELIGLLPEQYRGTMTGVCMILVSMGVIVAKDYNKTNAAIITPQTQTVPVVAPKDEPLTP